LDEHRHAGRIAYALQGNEAQLVFLAFVPPVRRSRQNLLKAHGLFEGPRDLASHAFVQRQGLFQQGTLKVWAEHFGQRDVVTADAPRFVEQSNTERCGRGAR
jgi:hypothetical protein